MERKEKMEYFEILYFPPSHISEQREFFRKLKEKDDEAKKLLAEKRRARAERKKQNLVKSTQYQVVSFFPRLIFGRYSLPRFPILPRLRR